MQAQFHTKVVNFVNYLKENELGHLLPITSHSLLHIVTPHTINRFVPPDAIKGIKEITDRVTPHSDLETIDRVLDDIIRLIADIPAAKHWIDIIQHERSNTKDDVIRTILRYISLFTKTCVAVSLGDQG